MLPRVAHTGCDVTIAAMNASTRLTCTFGLTVLVLALAVAGCVQRTISITSSPSGALVHLNDEEVGRTPLQVPYTFYGTYDVRLEKDGCHPLWTKQKTKAPWWEAPGPDLLAEMIPNNKVEQNWHFELQPAEFVAEDELIGRAKQLGDSLHVQGTPSGAAD